MSRAAFEVTRLAFADVVTFRRIIQDMRAQSVYRRMSYEHARDIIANFHRSNNDLSVLATAISDLESVIDQSTLPSDIIEPRNNKEVLENYLEAFASPFRPFAGELPPEFESYSIEIGGLRITGKPHLQVTNSRGTNKFLYLLTSKEWTDDQKSFFISILGEIVAANLDGASPRDVEGLDCRTGARITRNGLGANYRSRIEYLAEDLARMNLT